MWTDYFLLPGAREPLDLAGHKLSLLATREETGGSVSVFEARNIPSTIADRHIHHDSVKVSYILEGTYRWHVGDSVLDVCAGSFVLVPRHVPHHFEAGPDGGRQLFVFTPAGMEHFFMEAARLLAAGVEDPTTWDELHSRYDVEMVELPSE